MLGHAQIPAGVTGQCKNTFAFTDDLADQVDFTLTLPGPVNEDFDLHGDTGIFTWSTCGDSDAILNMNTECSINPTNEAAEITVSQPFPLRINDTHPH
jgi:hypothetical protein